MMMILLGRGEVGPTGWGLLASHATPEVGMELITRDQKTIRVMANYLHANRDFTAQFQRLEQRAQQH
jgi:hypothetical protein